jgi:hypothetical protein
MADTNSQSSSIYSWANPGVNGNSSTGLPPGVVAQPNQLQTTTNNPAGVIGSQVEAWARSEYIAAGYDNATAMALARQAGAKAQSAYAEAIAAGKTPLEAAEGARAQSSGSVIGELQKVGVTSLSNPGGLNPAQTAAANAGSTVGIQDRAGALNAYRQAMADGKENLQEILNNPISEPGVPFTPVTTSNVTAQKIALPGAPVASLATAAAPIKTGTVERVGAIDVAQATAAGPVAVERLSPAARLAAAKQVGTTVEGTTLETAEQAQAREQQQAAIGDLAATAQGQGAGQIAADARTKRDMGRQAALLAGAARQMRGVDRKGALRSATLASNEAALQAVAGREAQSAQERQTAQGALATSLQGVRSTDVDVAAKKADLQAQRNTLQAQLDAARNAGDAQRAQEITQKMADLDREEARFNAEQTTGALEKAAERETTVSRDTAAAKNTAGESAAGRAQAGANRDITAAEGAAESGAGRETTVSVANAGQTNALKSTAYTTEAGAATQDAANALTADTGNSDRGVKVQETNNTQGREAAVAQGGLEKDQAELRLKVNDAIMKAGQNQLDQESRDEALKIAKAQLALAQAKNDREASSYWFDKIAGLTVGLAGAAAEFLARGGLVSRPTLATVGEGDYRELVIPVSGKLSKALEKKLAHESKPFSKPVPIKALLAVIEKTTKQPAKELTSTHRAHLSGYLASKKKAS